MSNNNGSRNKINWDGIPCVVTHHPHTKNLVAVASFQAQASYPVPPDIPGHSEELKTEIFEQCGWEARGAIWDMLFGEMVIPLKNLHQFFFLSSMDKEDIDIQYLKLHASEAVENLNKLLALIDRRPNRQRKEKQNAIQRFKGNPSGPRFEPGQDG